MKLHKQILILFLLFFFALQIKAQNINEFYFEANTARKLANAGKIDSAIATYENAFKKVDYVFITYLEKVKRLAELNNDTIRVEKYTRQIIEQSKGTNPKLKAIIDSLIIVDQKVRTGKSSRKSRYYAKCIYKKRNCNVNSKRYKESKKWYDNWEKTDSLNTDYLLKLFKQYGFIGEELVGVDRYIDVWVILLHYDRDTNNTVLEPILEKAREEGKILPDEMAMIIDRHLGNKYTIQKYWTWPCIEKEKLQFTEADIPKIIKLRESIGIYDLWVKQEVYKGIYTLLYGKMWKLVNYYKN